MNDLELLAAYPLEAGKTYVIQLLTRKTVLEITSIREGLEAIADRTGCDFMVLDHELRLLRPELEKP